MNTAKFLPNAHPNPEYFNGRHAGATHVTKLLAHNTVPLLGGLRDSLEPFVAVSSEALGIDRPGWVMLSGAQMASFARSVGAVSQ